MNYWIFLLLLNGELKPITKRSSEALNKFILEWKISNMKAKSKYIVIIEKGIDEEYIANIYKVYKDDNDKLQVKPHSSITFVYTPLDKVIKDLHKIGYRCILVKAGDSLLAID